MAPYIRVMLSTGAYDSELSGYIGSISEMIEKILDRFPEHFFIYRPFCFHQEHWHITERLIERFGSDSRFLFDRFYNSKFCLAISDVMITDSSGLANTFTEIKKVRHISFDPYSEQVRPTSGPENYRIICDTPDDVINAINGQINTDENNSDYLSQYGDGLYNGITYLVDNIDYIIQEKKCPDWLYFNYSEVN